MEQNTSIYGQIRSEVSDFVNNDIEVVSGYTFNTYQTIKRCHLYYNSMFESNTNTDDREKIFYNIVKYRAKVASRMLNIDTKDIRLFPMNPNSKLSTFLLEKELKQWLKKNNIGQFLNRICILAPIYGSVFIKKTKKGAQVVDLRRVAFDPTVEKLTDSRFIILRHYLTDSELRKRGKENGWDKEIIEDIIRIDRTKDTNAPPAYPMRDSNTINIIRSTVLHEIDERYGEVPKSWLTGNVNDSEEIVRSVFICANSHWVDSKIEGNTTYEIDNGKTLFKSEWTKEYPFKDYAYDKTEGRLLGVGVIEDLFPAQERTNEMANQKRISMDISALHLFQTADQTIVQNVLTDLQSGDIIRNQSGINPIANEDRNLSSFAGEELRYNDLADRLSFAYDVTRGEALPSSTPATNAAIQNNNSQSEFQFRRENLALVLQDYFNELVLPQVLKDLTPEHIIRFCGSVDDLNYFDNEYAKLLADEKIVNGEVEVNGEQDRQMLIQQIISELKKQGKERFIKAKEKMYSDIEFEFDINIVNEQENVALIAQNTFTVLSAIAQNPAILQNPVLKTLLYKYAEKLGVNPLELEYKEQQADSQPQQGQIDPNTGQPMMAQPAQIANPAQYGR